MAFLTELFIKTAINLNPAYQMINIVSGGAANSMLIMPPKLLDLGTTINNLGIFNPIIEIWNWALYNLISPIFMIVFLILFFVGQYYLIKMNIYVFKNLGIKIFSIANFIIKSKKARIFISKFNQPLD